MCFNCQSCAVCISVAVLSKYNLFFFLKGRMSQGLEEGVIQELIKLSVLVLHISFPIITNYRITETFVYKKKKKSKLRELGIDKKL